MDNNKIYNLIDKFDVISFDIFDTLIKRVVNNPKQIFDIVEKKYNETHSEKIINFKNNRITSEREIQNRIAGINDIYDNMRKYYTDDVCEILKNIEILTEIEYCNINTDIKPIYEYCKRTNKKIYAVSDMYLHAEILEKILKKNSYDVENIIVSCEYNCNKNSSKLFKFIPEYGNKRILHIGDSLRADYLGAKRAGIQPLKIKKCKVKNNNDNYESLLDLKKTKNYFYNIGYSILSPILIDFANWLRVDFQKRNIKKIYFFSREGKIFKSVFDSLFKDEFNTNYLYISRRTITMANFNYMEFNDLNSILKYFTIKKNSTLADTIKYLGLDLNFDICDLKKNIYTFSNNKEIYKRVICSLKAKSNRDNQIVLEYFEQEKLEDKFAIVDIGWNGTMQKCLMNFLNNNNIKFNLDGYYFLVLNKFEKSQSYIDSNTNIGTSIKDNPILLENLFQYVDGSTIGYQRKGDKIEPIKMEIEFDSFTKTAIENIDNGTMDFISNWVKYGFVLDNEKFKKSNLDRFINFIDNPTKEDVKNFSKFCYSDIKSDGKIISDNINIKKGLYNSGWKYGYLKSKFKIKLNYKFIIKILKKIS